MKVVHRQLTEHFEELRRKRGDRVVYFLEHGIDTDDIKDLVTQVSAACEINPITSPFWRINYFPLLIVATEVGYKYRGNGTDFWPRFDAQLSINTTPSDRQSLSALFIMATERHSGATPPDTTWARAFHHIAWPITHAVLPLEFHHLFAQSLAELQQHHMDPTNDDALLQGIRNATRNRGSARFSTVLADQNLVLTLSRHFLRVPMEDQSLSNQVLNRISTDLRKDRTAARNIDIAYRQRRRADTIKNNISTSPRTPLLTPLIGTLYLRKQDSSGDILLEGILPNLKAELVQRVRKDLRRRRFAPKLWGISSRVSSDQLISGMIFRIGKLESMSDLTGPLIPDIEELHVDSEVKKQIERFTFDISTPLLFQERKDEYVAAQIRGNVASIGRIYWLLTTENVDTSDGVQVLGSLAGMKCVRVDPKEETGQALLRDEGIEIRYGTSAKWVGDPPVQRDATTPEYRLGDTIAMQVSPLPPDGTVVSNDEENKQVTLTPPGLIRLTNKLGTHSIKLLSEGRPLQIEYSVIKGSSNQEICWITLEGEEPSVQSLLRRAFSIRIDGIAPITALRLNISLSSGSVNIMCSKPLPPLPAVIGPNDSIWNRLLSDRMCDTLGVQQNILLRVIVSNIADAEWTLESRLKPCWWDSSSDDLRLISEAGELPYGYVPSESPTDNPTPSVSFSSEGTLLLPIPEENQQHDPITEFSSIFITPNTLNLRPPLLKKPNIFRSRNSNQGGIGLEQLIVALLRWSLADTIGVVADLRRRQITRELEAWVVRIICGDTWADIENTVLAQSCSPWDFLIDSCLQSNVGYDSYVELNPQENTRLAQLAIQQLKAIIPDLWVDPLGVERSEEIYEALDTAFARAYEQLATELKKTGQIDRAELAEQGDPGSAPSQWDEVLFTAQSSSELQALADLVYPTTGGDELASLDYSQMNLENLIDEIDDWTRKYSRALQGRRWSRDEVEAALSLWLDPEKVLRTSWRTATERFITDRWTSRAIRYAVLRRRVSLEAYASNGAYQ